MDLSRNGKLDHLYSTEPKFHKALYKHFELSL